MRSLSLIVCLTLIACPAEQVDDPPAADAGSTAADAGTEPTADAGAAHTDHTAMAKGAVQELCRFMYGCFNDSRLMQAFMALSGGANPMQVDCDTEVTDDTEIVEHLAAAMEAGRIVVDPVAFAACMATAECRTALNDGARGLPCAEAVTGTVVAGGGCFIDGECAGDGQTHRCSAEGAQCGSCVALLAPGEACEDGGECQPGFSCEEAEEGEDNVCTVVEPLLPAGAVCNAEDGPLDGNCDNWADLICVEGEGGSGEGVCTQATFDGQAGEPCFLFAGMFCADGLVCPMTFMPDEANPPTCREAVAAGETCLEGQGFAFMITPCESGYHCNDESRVCEAQKAAGEACEDEAECVDGGCSEEGFCEEGERFGEDGRGDYQLCQ